MKEDANNKTKIIHNDDMEVITENKTAEKKVPQDDDASKAEKQVTANLKDDFEENLLEKYKDYKILDIEAFKKFLIELKDFLFGITLDKSNYVEENEKEIKNQIKYPIKFGMVAVAVTFGFFVVWSGLAPLDSASIAEGFIILSENRKEIQHLEGGIVDKILVKDGDEVKKGQPLIVFNELKSKADLDSVLWQLQYAIVADKRLEESLKLVSYYQNNKDNNINDWSIDFDNKYLDKSDTKVLTLINAQKNSFNSFKAFIENSVKTFSTQVDQTKSEIQSLRERILSYQQNVSTAQKEYDQKKKLHSEQLVASDRLANIKMELQRYKGQVLEDTAKLTSLEHVIAGIGAKEAQFMDDQNVRLSAEYKENHTRLIQLEASYLHVKDVHKRSIVTAPYDGIVTNLRVHTVGAAIQPTQPLLEIIPQDDKLVIEAYIPSHEVESIQVGSITRIQLNAYKARLVPRIEGKVTYISADKFDQPNGGMMPGKLTPVSYYKARIEVPQEELDKVNTEIKLLPGMPVTVFIVKGTRTFAGYLYSPIKDSFHKAFKEP